MTEKRKEKSVDLLYNLANTSFGGAAIGASVSLAVGAEEKSRTALILLVFLGIFATIAFAFAANNVLKIKKEDEHV